jgi:glycosyltransferase involved in cell wall biosynthesis
MPYISVVIPAYNAERTLKETIQSVQDQTLTDIEIIIINDGSTDQTWNLIENLADSRIKAFSYENGGVAVARNRGITHAIGEFIAFIDADDLWTPDKLELQLDALKQHPEAGVAYSWNYFYYEKTGDRTPGHVANFEGNVYAPLLQENFLANGSNPLIRRQAIDQIGGFDSTFPHCADWDFYLRLAAQWQFVRVPKHQVFYRQSSHSMSSTKVNEIERQCLAMLEKAYQAAPIEYQLLKSKSLAWIYEYCTQQYLQSSHDRAGVQIATRKFWKAVQLRPQILSEGYGQSLTRWLIKRWLSVLVHSDRLVSSR